MPKRIDTDQAELFAGESSLPEGFDYREDAISRDEERALVERFAALPFRPFDFHGFLGKRRVVSFGWRYDYSAAALGESDAIPDFLLGLRERAAAAAALPAESLQQVLVTEYAVGAGIGWHRDKPVFGDVVAFSFLSACRLRLRRRQGAAWQRKSVLVQPRSLYILRGAVRHQWEHSVPPVTELRYAVTFRNLANR